MHHLIGEILVIEIGIYYLSGRLMSYVNLENVLVVVITQPDKDTFRHSTIDCGNYVPSKFDMAF